MGSKLSCLAMVCVCAGEGGEPGNEANPSSWGIDRAAPVQLGKLKICCQSATTITSQTASGDMDNIMYNNTTSTIS